MKRLTLALAILCFSLLSVFCSCSSKPEVYKIATYEAEATVTRPGIESNNTVTRTVEINIVEPYGEFTEQYDGVIEIFFDEDVVSDVRAMDIIPLKIESDQWEIDYIKQRPVKTYRRVGKGTISDSRITGKWRATVTQGEQDDELEYEIEFDSGDNPVRRWEKSLY